MSNIRNLLAAALLASAGNAVAASSVDLSVKGTITPSACTPSFSSGGNFDLGKLAAKDLNVDTVTRINTNMQIRVTCAASTFFAFEGHDNRQGSVPDSHEGNFGLGIINGDEKPGSFYATLTSAVADGVPARFILSIDGGESWWPSGELTVGVTNAVANNTSLTPMPVQVLTGEMELKVIIAPSKNLTLTEEVPLDGSATVTVKYL
ncbi:DUF1120 domain-containing protein [Pseudomonas trivialis]|uniref:DUF1120 domain-containing protein n=1 Tax=Pseudomonas trivialis TaxID=200450 RepID=A0A0H5A5B9_9PSED|nr:DUF1120 domain-containing protein [Pseudomonas trivialis]AKS06229.1 hypothetical protein AA957_08955 [Pseudomonas trivialis]